MAVNLAVLIVFVVLTVFQFDQVRSTLENERLKVVADRASEPLALAAAIGLDLSTVRSLDAVLERARQADDAIIALHVLDPEGAITASTAGSDRAAAGPETLRRLNEGSAAGSYAEAGDYRYLVTFERSAGDTAGALLIEYSGVAAKTSVWAMAGRLATIALVFALISGVFSVLAVKQALRGERQMDQEFATADIDGLRRLWRGNGEKRDSAAGDGIAGAMREADLRYRAARNTIT